MKKKGIDSITTEVIRYELVAAAEEMQKAFKRSTLSMTLYELNDFGMSLFDQDFNMLADAPGLCLFTGSLGEVTRASVERVGRQNLAPGDVLVNTVPFDLGSQTADAAVITPIFFGRELIGYAALKAHFGDLGAIDPYPTTSTDMFQEGLLLPALKLYRRGRLNDEIVQLIRANSRRPVVTAGNFLAGAAAVRLAAKRMEAIARTHGLRVFREAIGRILAHGEQLARAAIAEMPDGTATVVDYVDNNGVGTDPVKIVVTVTIKGSDLIVDLSGSAPQQGGPINCPFPGAVSACRYAMKALAVPRSPANEGHFRPLKVIAPPGSLFHPLPPAPTFLYAWSALRLADLIPLALAKAIPDKVPASSGSDVSAILVYFHDYKTGRGTHVGGAEPIGMGACGDFDGENALLHHSEAGCCSIPTEVIENRVPLLVDYYELRPDSGGPGRHRGGLGIRKQYQALRECLAISVMDRVTGPAPAGLNDGKEGRRGVTVFHRGTPREVRGGRIKRTLEAGDRAGQDMHGGGGHGDPFTRDPQAVLEDVRDGYVSLQGARDDYGVVVDVERWAVDAKGTARLRGAAR